MNHAGSKTKNPALLSKLDFSICGPTSPTCKFDGQAHLHLVPEQGSEFTAKAVELLNANFYSKIL